MPITTQITKKNGGKAKSFAALAGGGAGWGGGGGSGWHAGRQGRCILELSRFPVRGRIPGGRITLFAWQCELFAPRPPQGDSGIAPPWRYRITGGAGDDDGALRGTAPLQRNSRSRFRADAASQAMAASSITRWSLTPPRGKARKSWKWWNEAALTSTKATRNTLPSIIQPCSFHHSGQPRQFRV